MTCKQCGSTYSMRRIKIIMRDKDSIRCEVCGETLISWNGAEMFEATLTNRAAWPPPQSN